MKNLASILGLATLATSVIAAPLTFDFKDPKGVNNAVFKLDAPLEAIQGSANGISGTVTFDPASPATTQGKITVATKTLQVPNPLMKEHLDGAQWMDVAKFPEIVFELKRLSNVTTSGDTTTADVTGALTVKGVTKEVTTKATATYLKDKLSARSNGQMQGDLLVLRTNFTIKRSDYGINPGAPQDKVADTIDLSLSIAGFSKRP
ncbi:MAG TPA: YceI family protein [Verrucomicrobiota bacterium]|nr:hypothetical protein [Verrucomicrobiales bacterium]HRI15554.1 YceI family protein [Verrucomicrobiota bacterium]